MGCVDTGCLYLLALFIELIPGGQILVLPVDSGLGHHVRVAEDDRNVAHERNRPHRAVLGDGVDSRRVESVLVLRLSVDGGQVQQVDGALVLHHVAGAGEEHVGKSHACHQAGQKIGVVFADQGDGVYIFIFFAVFLDPLVKELALVV